jgi:hypothetical protein
MYFFTHPLEMRRDSLSTFWIEYSAFPMESRQVFPSDTEPVPL